MEKIVKQGLLYDFYGALLNDHQRLIYELVVYDNMSLSEIASEQGISRQGVHDLIKRCDKSLEEYENKLHLVERFMAIKDEVEIIETKAESAEIKAIAAKILEQL
ncbi:MAG: DNA-binding protein [Lachnospiraceae bacterium]|nr:DNA-binding protein [Lachnospiraceae bacterium]